MDDKSFATGNMVNGENQLVGPSSGVSTGTPSGTSVVYDNERVTGNLNVNGTITSP